MKKIILMLMLFSTNVFAAVADRSNLACLDAGATAVAASAKVNSNQTVSFVEGASFGDSINSIYILSYQVSGHDGYYLVKLTADGCVASKVLRINN